jgi:hypothetical protein
MKLLPFPLARRPAGRRGYVLLLVLCFATVSFLILGAALDWCMTNAKLNDRNNQYFTTVAAAEAATEKVLASLGRDFQAQGESMVWANLGNYRQLVPTAAENPAWGGFGFSDATGNAGQTYVERLSAASYRPLQSQYQGIYGFASTYRVVSNARMLGGSGLPVNAGVKQDVQLASIPVFQFAIFYTMDLEINPGPDMIVTGRVHGNANINLQPVNSLTFLSHVTAVDQILLTKDINDPTVRNLSSSQITFLGEHDSSVGSLTLPIGTNNSPEAVHAIVELPQDGEDADSPLGRQRFYNKADLVVVVSNGTASVRSGLVDSFATDVPQAQWQTFLNTNASFFNKREGKMVKASEIDVGKLNAWSATNTLLRPALGGRDIRSVYVADYRTQSSSTEVGVRIKDGQTLPSLGLTVATPNPLYVQGNYNAPSAYLGTTNTAFTKPAALIGDSINILSAAWSDANSGQPIGSRTAADTTVNAALLGGIVPSGGGYYSGGVENFPRFLENWSGRKLAYNGSMVVMYYSKTATAPWGGSDVYSPPNRQWTFDLNFMDATKLPPGTPEVRAIIRAEWAAIRPGSVY